jgi:hypothetical protein
VFYGVFYGVFYRVFYGVFYGVFLGRLWFAGDRRFRSVKDTRCDAQTKNVYRAIDVYVRGMRYDVNLRRVQNRRHQTMSKGRGPDTSTVNAVDTFLV